MTRRVAGDQAGFAALRTELDDVTEEIVELDIIQPADIYFDLSGEDIRRRIFLLENEAGPLLCLRPDQTIPAARHYLATAHEGSPARLRYEGRVFRRAVASGGPAIEFTQMGVEFIAPPSIETVESEVYSALNAACIAVGWDVPPVTFSDANLIQKLLEEAGAPPQTAATLQRRFERGRLNDVTSGSGPEKHQIAQLLRSLGKRDATTLYEEMLKAGNIHLVGDRPVGDIIGRLCEKAEAPEERQLSEWLPFVREVAQIRCALRDTAEVVSAMAKAKGFGASAWADEWTQRIARLEASGFSTAQLSFSADLARSFNYYDGAVFEISVASGSSRKVIAAGGRFHKLFERLGASQPIDAFGFALRPERLISAGAGRS